jgi:hypothetical protein
VHPEEQDLVVKIAVNGSPDGWRSNTKELHGYQDLIRKHVDLQHISHCLGFITTNKGKGLVCQAIRDDDGTLSQSIWDIIVYQEHCDIELIKRVVFEFCAYLTNNDVFLFDLNLKNILLKRLKDGTYVPYAVDLKGRYDIKEAIPFSKYSRFFARRKLERRTRQLLNRIDEYAQIKPVLKDSDKRLNRELHSS